MEAVIDAVRVVAAGRRYLSSTLQALEAEARSSASGPPHERLSPRERQVFDRLVAGMSVNAIAGELEISASTASNHLSRTRRKLGVQSNGEVLVYASRAGLIQR